MNIDVNDSAVKHSSKNNPFLSLEALERQSSREGEAKNYRRLKKDCPISHLYLMIYSCTKSNYIKENPKIVSVHCYVTAPRPQFQSWEVETLHAALTHEGAGLGRSRPASAGSEAFS